MKLDFKNVKLKDDSIYLERLIESYNRAKISNNVRNEFKNEFIIVGQTVINNDEYFKVNQLNEKGLNLFSDIALDVIALEIPKKNLYGMD